VTATLLGSDGFCPPDLEAGLLSVCLRIGTGVIAVVVVTGLAGCANAPRTPAAHDARAKAASHPRSPSTTAPTTTTTASTSTTTTAPPAAPAALRDGPGPQATYVVQPQPPAGSCHYTYVFADPLPDPHCTPGALNPQVSQGTLASTICKSGYSSSIRPPESITEPEKRGSALAYGYTGPFSTGEYDHLVSLELGGDPNDPANLWVEPNDNPNATTTANSKDVLEDRLHSLVCSGQLSLATAQQAIASNWVTAYQQYVGALPSSPAPGAAAPPSSATCTASATPANDGYSGDYYVSVTSNQPNQRATASDPGDTWSHDTDASGSVRILLYRTSAGEQINVTVGAASCPTVAQ
jgi:hypothetical protein